MNTKTLKKNVALTEKQALVILDALHHYKHHPPVQLGMAGLQAADRQRVDSAWKLVEDAMNNLACDRLLGTLSEGVFEEGAAQGQMTDGGFVENKPSPVEAEAQRVSSVINAPGFDFKQYAVDGGLLAGGDEPRIIRAESVSLPERRADGMFPPGRATGVPWYRPFKHSDGWWYINTPHGAYPIRDIHRIADAAAEAAASKGAASTKAKPSTSLWAIIAGWLGFARGGRVEQ